VLIITPKIAGIRDLFLIRWLDHYNGVKLGRGRAS
jgi:hypothetical protein